MKIRRFGSKSISIYHGYKGAPAQDRIDCLREMGFENIISDYIDYDYEWDLDMCQSLFNREIRKCQGIDIIMGFSLGGYLAFRLSGSLSKDVLLVNPALDRNKTMLDIKHFNAPHKTNFGKIELFLGSNDTLIDKNVTRNYLNREKIRYSEFVIKGMEHRTPINFFEEILNKSSII